MSERGKAITEMQAQRQRLESAGIPVKHWYAHGDDCWVIFVEYVDADGVDDLIEVNSVAEVDGLIGAYCPACQRVDGRRRTGGPCRRCREAAG